MERDDLIIYFLEKEGYSDPKKTKEERDLIANKFFQNTFDPNSKFFKVVNLNQKFEKLWGYENEIIDEETIKKDFEDFKKVVTKLIKLIPEDYFLKGELTYNGIDYETFDEYSFEFFRWKKKDFEYDSRLEELEWDNSLSDEEKMLVSIKLFKEHELKRKPNFNKETRNKLYSYLDELESKIKKNKNKYEEYYDLRTFIYGRMYIYIVSCIKDLLNHEEQDVLKEKEELYIRYVNLDLKDNLECLNELGFLAYYLNDKNTYNDVIERNKYFDKRGLIPYFLKYIDKIFQKDNDKYIKKIIKENFLFFPCLIFNEGMNKYDDNEIVRPLKGSEKEAYRLIDYCNVYLSDLFNDRNQLLIKDYMKNIKDYFNFFFDDQDLTYFLFRSLEDEYMSSEKDIYSIEDIKNQFKIKTRSNDEEFEKCFKNLCNTKLIKKVNQINYQINEGFETFLDLDFEEKDFENNDEFVDLDDIEGSKA